MPRHPIGGIPQGRGPTVGMRSAREAHADRVAPRLLRSGNYLDCVSFVWLVIRFR